METDIHLQGGPWDGRVVTMDMGEPGEERPTIVMPEPPTEAQRIDQGDFADPYTNQYEYRLSRRLDSRSLLYRF
ncbi:MAG: hypothetical protein ACTID3_15450 [Halomonas sp.]|uniref:hypothetical protein n=1 Tax=Halomonas sp. TaxID=1486246 RepID=UPI003F8E041B